MGTMVYKNSSGKIVPSVTTVISNLGWNKQALMYWSVKMMKQGINPLEYRDKAAELGTLIHSYIEAHIYGTEVSLEEKQKFEFEDILIAEKGLQFFKQKEKELGILWKESELPLVSEQYQYGGTMDGVAVIDGVLNLIDVKSSNDIWADHIIQLGAYHHLLLENTNYIPQQFRIIKVSKDKEKILTDGEELVKFIEIPMESIKRGFDVFLKLRDIHQFKSTMEKEVKELKTLTNKQLTEEV